MPSILLIHIQDHAVRSGIPNYEISGKVTGYLLNQVNQAGRKSIG
jgi:hypothetical protein